MHAIRPYIALAVIVIIVGAVAGAVPALWTACAAAACMILNSSASLVHPDHSKWLRQMREQVAQGASVEKAIQATSYNRDTVLINVLELGSIVLAVASSITLGLAYGWLPALGIVIAFLGFALLRDNEGAKARRRAVRARRTVCYLVADHRQGRITEEQMLARSSLVLDQDLMPVVYGVPSLYEPVIAAHGLPPAEHHVLLCVLKAYLGAREGSAHRHSEMYQAVRDLLDATQKP